MRLTVKNALEIEQKYGGAVMSSEWTTGSGGFTLRRPVPAYCKVVGHPWKALKAADLSWLSGKSKQSAARILKKHPRVRMLIVVDDRRAMNMEAKKG